MRGKQCSAVKIDFTITLLLPGSKGNLFRQQLSVIEIKSKSLQYLHAIQRRWAYRTAWWRIHTTQALFLFKFLTLSKTIHFWGKPIINSFAHILGLECIDLNIPHGQFNGMEQMRTDRQWCLRPVALMFIQCIIIRRRFEFYKLSFVI